MKLLEAADRQLARLGEGRFYFLLLLGMTVVTVINMVNLALSLHRNFLTTACDTAAFQNAIVNTLHGNWFRDTVYAGPNILGLHTTLILLLLAPVYGLFPSVDTLFILQACGVYSTVIPLYLIALEVLKKPFAAFLIAGATLASPLLPHMALAPFHPETWIAAIVLWSYYFYLRNRAIGYWLTFGLAVSCGEQAALIYVALGVTLLVIEDDLAWRNRYGLWTLGAGVGWLMFTVFVFLPIMRQPGQTNLFATHYSDWGIQSGDGLVGALAKKPIQVVEMVFSPSRWIHVAALVGFPLLLVLFARRSLILLALFPFYFLMSDQEFFLPFHAYYFQFAFLAGCYGLISFLGRRDIYTRIGTMVIVATVFVNVVAFSSAYGVYARLDMGASDAFDSVLLKEFNKIPKDAGVYGPHRFSEYLSDRKNMVMGDISDQNFDFYDMLNARYSITDVGPQQIDYIVSDLINDQCGWRDDNFNSNTSKVRGANITKLVQSGQWQVVFNQGNVVILKRVEE